MQLFTPFIVKKKSLLTKLTALALSIVVVTVLLSQTVFAQNIYVITDGDQVRVHTTYATDPATVLDEAGVKLDEGDIYTTQPGDGVSEITVQRSQRITVYHCGEPMEVTSYGETLEELLVRVGVPAYGSYTVSRRLNQMTYDGMEVSVDYITEERETYTVEIPYETITCYDPSLAEGTEKVLVAGTVGQLKRTADVLYVNQVEDGRVVLEETLVKRPANRIVVVGTGKKTDNSSQAPAIGDGVIVTSTGEILTYDRAEQFKATAYTKTDAGCDDFTATGTYARVGAIAVDPKVIPYGTRMFIVSNDGKYIYGVATAEDCGGSIKGNRVDLYFDTTAECFQFGVRYCTIYFLT